MMATIGGRRGCDGWLRRGTWLGLVLSLAGLIGLPRATASPIRIRQDLATLEARRAAWRLAVQQRHEAMLASRAQQQQNYWQRYFTRALQQHQLNVKGPNALRVLSASPSGVLPHTAFVEYLQWRRGLNPARFDHFHPQLGQMLLQDQIARSTVPPPVVVPKGPVEPGGVNPPPPIGPQVPEPNSGLIALVLIGAGVSARRWASGQRSG